MQAIIKFLNTGKTQTLEVSEILYTAEKIVLFQENGGFTSFFHGDKVEVEIKPE